MNRLDGKHCAPPELKRRVAFIILTTFGSSGALAIRKWPNFNRNDSLKVQFEGYIGERRRVLAEEGRAFGAE